MEDLTGRVFGRLTVIEKAPPSRDYRTRYVCLCQCGKKPIVQARYLLAGSVVSCGCLRAERLAAQKRHGEKGTPLYNVWRSMRQRCRKPCKADEKAYKGKGVKVCPEWESYEAFREWAYSNGYQPPAPGTPRKDHLSIDRIDPAGDYCPDNCRWITISANSKRVHRKEE